VGIGAVSLALMSFWLRAITALAVLAGVLAPISASGAQTLAQVQAKVRQLEEDATAAAEGAQEAKVKLAGLNRTLSGIKAKAEIQGQTVSALQKSLGSIAVEQYKTGGFGPWMVTSDEIAPAQVMRLQTVLNGQVLQDTTTDKMIHSIPRQIAYISTFIPLSPGDVIVTGTPGGVGNKRTPQIFMKPGDVCEIVVDAIGTLRNGIRDDA